MGSEARVVKHTFRVPQITTDMSALATEKTLREVRDRLPSSLTASNNFKTSIEESRIKVPVDIQDHWQANVVLLPSAARTASGVGSDVDVSVYTMGEILLDVTAVSGTNPALNVYIEGKNTYTGKYKVLFSELNITSINTFWYTITHNAWRFLRVRWEISGTSPSFTFSVSMEAKS